MMLAKNITAALHTIRARRGRSLVTMLGIVIAVASVTSVVSIGHGVQDAVSKQANQYSKNVITIRPVQIGGSGLSTLLGGAPATALTTKDVATVAKIPGVVEAVPLTVVGTAAQADNQFKGVVFGVSSSLPSVLNQELAYGAFFTDAESSSNIAVLGANAADSLFDQKVPLGRTFTIRGQQFIVSGVLTKFAATPFASSSNFNDAIFVPDSAARSVAPNGATMYEILAKVRDDNAIAAADAGITKALSKAHDQADYQVLAPTELSGDSTATFELLSYMILAAAIITLLVSGIGIMNVMLVSVTERMHEIGIRKAVGATNRQILGQFTTEAATLSVVGSLIGALVALVIVVALRFFSSLSPSYDWKVAGLACLVACLFGIVFGTLPAIKAARKDPIEALRSE